MSFSKEVKEEISKHIPSARHCQIAELAAILNACGQFEMVDEDTKVLSLYTDSLLVARKYFTLVKKTFNINANISIRRNLHLKKGKMYELVIRDPIIYEKIYQRKR